MRPATRDAGMLADALRAFAAAPPRGARHLASAARSLAARLDAVAPGVPWEPLGVIAWCTAEERAGRRHFGQSDAYGRAAVWEEVARERHAAGDVAGAAEALGRAAAELGPLLAADATVHHREHAPSDLETGRRLAPADGAA